MDHGALPLGEQPQVPADGRAGRCFLGWDGPALPAAARWLVQRHGAQMGSLLVAVPGRRAGRRLEELLATEQAGLGAGAAPVPARVLTSGRLSDVLLATERPAAGHLARTLTWSAALRDLAGEDRATLRALLPHPPRADDGDGWLALAELLAALHGRSLAPECVDFAVVAAHLRGAQRGAEARRWEALAEVQRRYRLALEQHGLADPHDARREALEAGRVDDEARVVLVGVVEMSGLLRRTLARLGPRVTSLVMAPADEADAFDELGCVLAEAWAGRHLPLDTERWSVVRGPGDQARCVVETLRGFAGRYPATGISVGVPDEALTPFVQRRLTQAGVPARHAAGEPLSRSPPLRLLASLADYLAGRRFAAWAALLRHPDLEDALARSCGEQGACLAAELDEVQARHLPERDEGAWQQRRNRFKRLKQAREELLSMLGELAGDGRAPWHAWAAPVSGFLCSVYEHAPQAAERFEALAGLRALLDELEDLVALEQAVPPVGAAEALRLLVRRAALAPPLAPPAAAQAVELLGWLELPLDDAPALVLTGCNAGRLPRAPAGDPFLPEALRVELGLPGRDQREARDAWALTAMAHARQELHLISGRVGADRDPLLPSPLLFRCPDDEALRRVARWTAGGREAARRAPAAAPAERLLPRDPDARTPQCISVTAFRDWLQSPYLFYLRHVLGLKEREDRARELDPLAFGSLAHDVLQAFGENEVQHATDPSAIAAFLGRALDAHVHARYGRLLPPAVLLQVHQLRRRLDAFAGWQAQHRAAGWRIARVECEPGGEHGVPFEVDGRAIGLRGRIDRIDHHTEQGWLLLDYKTSERAAKPRTIHGPGRDEGWKDLQLPLYGLLAEGITGQEPVAYGYLNLSRELGAAAKQTPLARADWTPGELGAAFAAAREVVRGVRRCDFFRLGTLRPGEGTFSVLAGQGLLAAVEEAGDEDPDGEEGP